MPTYMYVSLQDDDKVVQFGMDPETGRLNREAEYPLPGGAVVSGDQPRPQNTLCGAPHQRRNIQSPDRFRNRKADGDR
jgi:hypothetical protein